MRLRSYCSAALAFVIVAGCASGQPAEKVAASTASAASSAGETTLQDCTGITITDEEGRVSEHRELTPAAAFKELPGVCSHGFVPYAAAENDPSPGPSIDVILICVRPDEPVSASSTEIYVRMPSGGSISGEQTETRTGGGLVAGMARQGRYWWYGKNMPRSFDVSVEPGENQHLSVDVTVEASFRYGGLASSQAQHSGPGKLEVTGCAVLQ